MKRSRAIVTSVLVTISIVFLLAVMAYKSPAQREMESLIAFVLTAGEPTYVPAGPLNYFKLPSDDLTFHELRAVSQSGRTRAIQVRRRDSGAVDVFLLDLLPNSFAGFFYLTDNSGRLRNSVFFDEAPEAVHEPDKKLEHELGFWKLWQRERLNRLPR